MTKIKVFLTGGSGYIGKNIVEQLGDVYHIVCPRHSQLELLNPYAVEKFFKTQGPFDAIVHCAFIGGSRKDSDTAETLRDNLRIFFNIARNKAYFGKLINLGSGAEYGKYMPLTRVRETDFDKVVPLETDYYGFAKYIISKYVEEADNFINLRLFGVYGKYEDTYVRFISNAICKYILGFTISINRNVYFDYLYVKDLAKVIGYFISNKTRYKSYNIGTGKPIDLVAIANKINKIANRKSPIKIKNRGLGNAYTCNNKRLLEEMDGFEFTNFDKSLEELYKWYLQRKKYLNKKDFVD